MRQKYKASGFYIKNNIQNVPFIFISGVSNNNKLLITTIHYKINNVEIL